MQTNAGITKQGRRWVRERHHKRLMEKQMPLEEVLAFSPAQIHRCFLALGLLLEGISFPSQLHQGQLTLFARPKPSHGHGRGRTPCFPLPVKCRAAPFSSLRPLPTPALVSGSWVWPRGPHTPLCRSAGATLSNTPPQLEKLWTSNLLTVPSTLGTEVLALLSEPAFNVATYVDLPAAPVSSPVH